MAASITSMLREDQIVKAQISDIKRKSKAILRHPQNANDIVDIIAFAESEESDVVLGCIHAFHKIFIALISNESMFLEAPPKDEADYHDFDSEDKVRVWLRDRYADSKAKLLQLLIHPEVKIQEQALVTLMNFLECEAKHPLKKFSVMQLAFPVSFCEQLIRGLLDPNTTLPQLMPRFQEFLEYDDVRYYSMKFCLKFLKQEKSTDVFFVNLFNILERLSMPTSGKDDCLNNFLSHIPESQLKISNLREQKKLFTTLWLEFLKCQLAPSLYKRVLLSLHDKVMPYMTSPLLLTDFLTQSYNIGGSISLLALNGIFLLVNNYNLNYPDFYEKLYQLLEPSVFHMKYRARFFYLTDLFLTSTHLSAYLVAAFVKKISRLALTAPPDCLSIILPLVLNLLRRHPNCKVLLHRQDHPTAESEELFDMSETDPAKCNALQSSLWELKTLQRHYHHTISTAARQIERDLTLQETDISELLDTSTNDLINKEIKRKVKQYPTNFNPARGLFDNKDDTMKNLWSIS